MRYVLGLLLLNVSCHALTIDESVYRQIDASTFPQGRSVTYTANWQTAEFAVVENLQVTYLKYGFHYTQSFNVFTPDNRMAADFAISYSDSGKLLREVRVEAGNLWRVTAGHLQAANNPDISDAEYVCVEHDGVRYHFLIRDGLYVYRPGLVINKPAADPGSPRF